MIRTVEHLQQRIFASTLIKAHESGKILLEFDDFTSAHAVSLQSTKNLHIMSICAMLIRSNAANVQAGSTSTDAIITPTHKDVPSFDMAKWQVDYPQYLEEIHHIMLDELKLVESELVRISSKKPEQDQDEGTHSEDDKTDVYLDSDFANDMFNSLQRKEAIDSSIVPSVYGFHSD